MKTSNIREAQSADISRLIILASQLGYTFSDEVASERLKQISADSSQKLFICEYQGMVVGWIHICGSRRFLSEPFAEIVGFIVDEEFRSRGLGCALLSHAEEWAKSQKYHILRIRSNVIRQNTISYYEKRGYQLAKTQNVFVKSQ